MLMAKTISMDQVTQAPEIMDSIQHLGNRILVVQFLVTTQEGGCKKLGRERTAETKVRMSDLEALQAGKSNRRETRPPPGGHFSLSLLRF